MTNTSINKAYRNKTVIVWFRFVYWMSHSVTSHILLNFSYEKQRKCSYSTGTTETEATRKRGKWTKQLFECEMKREPSKSSHLNTGKHILYRYDLHTLLMRIDGFFFSRINGSASIVASLQFVCHISYGRSFRIGGSNLKTPSTLDLFEHIVWNCRCLHDSLFIAVINPSNSMCYFSKRKNYHSGKKLKLWQSYLLRAITMNSASWCIRICSCESADRTWNCFVTSV